MNFTKITYNTTTQNLWTWKPVYYAIVHTTIFQVIDVKLGCVK